MRIVPLVQRAKAQIAEFKHANTQENFYMMTDGGDGVGYAENLCALLEEAVTAIENASGSPFSEKVRSMLGKRVRVTYVEGDKANRIVTGKLIGWGHGGDFEIVDESDGMLHYAWPLLKIEEADGAIGESRSTTQVPR